MLAILCKMYYNLNMNKAKIERKRFNGWIDVEVLKKVEQMAKKEKRSLSNMVECILTKAVEGEDK